MSDLLNMLTELMLSTTLWLLVDAKAAWSLKKYKPYSPNCRHHVIVQQWEWDILPQTPIT